MAPKPRVGGQFQQPTRYRPGKPEPEHLSEQEDESDEEEQEEEVTTKPAPRPPRAPPPPPKATSFPAAGKRIDLPKTVPKPPPPDLDGFVTASESSEEEGAGEGSSDEDSGEDESSEEAESLDDDEPKKPMLRPTFISKAKRAQTAGVPAPKSAEDVAAEAERQRKEKADQLLQAQLERDAALRASGRRAWDDDADINAEDEVDDTDDVDPEAELAAWKVRELKRVRRDRLAIEEKEKEREEIERRRNMTEEERAAEDAAHLAAQQGEREGRGKMGYMQKYFHKGAFFNADGEEQDEEVKAALNRDLAGARFEDEGDKSVLPEYMRIRDMTRLGKKGRTRYKDLKNEDTGRWGVQVGGKKRELDDRDVRDERFRPDTDTRGREQTGANAQPVGERRGPEKRARYE